MAPKVRLTVGLPRRSRSDFVITGTDGARWLTERSHFDHRVINGLTSYWSSEVVSGLLRLAANWSSRAPSSAHDPSEEFSEESK